MAARVGNDDPKDRGGLVLIAENHSSGVSGSRRGTAIVARSHLWWQIMFFGAALVVFVAMGFWTVENHVLTPNITFASYEEVFSTGRYFHALVNSVRLASVVAIAATALALPVSHVLAFRCTPSARRVVIVLIVAPFLTNYVIRMFGWQIWLSEKGIVNGLLAFLPGNFSISGILYTEMAVVIGLVSAVLPLAVVLEFLSMSRIEPTLRAAAKNLGASPWQVFLRLDARYAIPGLVLSFLFSFLISVGDFVSSSVLGGNNTYYIATAMQDRARVNEWPTAGVLGNALLVTAAIVVFVGFWTLSRAQRPQRELS